MHKKKTITHTEHVTSHHTRPTIGFFFPRFDQGGYISKMWAGITDTVREHDLNLICFVGERLRAPGAFEAQRNILYDLADVRNLDGIVVVGPMFIHTTSEEQEQFFERYRSAPKVCISSPIAGIPTAVVGDDYAGMKKLLTHLIDTHAYRRIAFIRGPESSLDAEKRYHAYVDVLAAHHIPLNPNCVLIGNFRKESGSAAIETLLDKRKLRPGTDIEAVVASNDNMAIGALEALHARGIKVPHDLVVTGFDDIEEARFTTPPLTTVHQPLYEMGRRAVDVLLAQFQRENTPEQEVLSMKLVVRQSCHCLALEVAQAEVEPATEAPDESFEAGFNIPRETVIAEMVQAVGGDVGVSGWAESLLDGVIAEEQGTCSGAFVSAMYGVLQQVAEAGGEITLWQNAISVLWRHVRPSFGKDGRGSRARPFWQQARIVIGEMAQRVEGDRWLQAEQLTAIVNDIGQALMITFDVEDLMDVLAQELPRLNIPGCYLALYEDPQPYSYPQPVPPWSRLILAYNEQGRMPLEPGGRRFPSHQLVPEGSFPQGRSYSMVMLSLHFQEDQLGFILFEIGPQEGTIYDILRGQISSSLQGALLVQQVREHAHELAAAYEEIQVLNNQLQEENVRMSAELNVARRLQEMILPPAEELRQIEGLEIVGYMKPADEVGGDYYDVLRENGILHIGIGDVTGHGLESGVLMLMTQTAIRTLIEHGETDPIKFVITLNRTIYKNVHRMGADKTLTFALIEYQRGQLKIVGQHEELLVVRQGGQVDRVDTLNLGFPIGLEEEIAQWVATATISLESGDTVVLYTDGITEAENEDRKLYGIERLCDVVSRHWDRSAEEIKQTVIEDVIRYIGKQKIYDDLTLIVLKQK
jgi:serine phosphatase RsbU (regulator of sigma subunit)/DNA-binding LacI/PurR family transcriptional regulator